MKRIPKIEKDIKTKWTDLIVNYKVVDIIKNKENIADIALTKFVPPASVMKHYNWE